MSRQPSPPMVGRERELALATRLLDRLGGSEGGGALLLLGEPGIGKTALLNTLQRGARDRAYRVRRTGCVPLSTPLPLEPVTHLLLGDATLRAPGEPDPARTEQYADALRALRGLASSGPTVLLLDDLQWSDRATLSFLQAAIAREEPGEVLWVLATRPGAHATTMAEVLHRLPHATTMELTGLDVAGVAHLARGLEGPPADGVIETVHRRTGGNPFLALELLRSAADARLGHGELPRGVRDSVVVRRRELSGPADALLRWCAVLPEPIQLDWLAELCGLDALGSVVELVDGAFLTHGTDRDSVHFAHDLLRDAVVDALPGPIRRAMHTEVAEVLRGAPLELRAVQLRAAGDARGAAELYLQLADTALRRGGPLDAVAHARQASDLAAEAGDRSTETAALGVEALAQLRLGRTKAGHELARRVRRRLRDGPGTPRARFLARYAMACWDDAADLDRAQDAVDELAPLEASLEGVDAAEACLARAHITNRAGRFAQALPLAQEAVRLARSIVGPETTATTLLPRALAHLGLLEGQAGSIDASNAALEEAVDLAQDHGLPAEEGYAWLVRSFLAQHVGDEAAHEQLARRGLEVAGLPAVIEAMLRANAGVGAVWRGDVADGLLELEQAVEVAALAGRATRDRVAVTLVHALARHGEIDQAAATLADIDAPPGSWEGTRVTYARALVAEERGDDATARIGYLAGCDDEGNPSSIWSLAGVVRTSCALGELSAAREALGRLEQRAARWPVGEWLVTASRAEVADLVGDTVAATDGFTAAADRYNRVDHLRCRARAAIAARDAPAVDAVLSACNDVLGVTATDRLRARAVAAGIPLAGGDPTFELRVLGPFELLMDETHVDLPAGRALQLLGLLALDGEQPTARVIDVLWPQASEQSGRQRLRQALYRLRRLAPGLVVRSGHDRIAVAAGTRIDLRRFDELVLLASAREDEAERHARSALELVRGDVLETIDLDLGDLEAIREQVRALRRGLHDRLAEIDVARGDLVGAAAHLQAGVELDPTDRTRVDRLVRILHKLGRQVEADGLIASTTARLHALGLAPPRTW